MHKNFDAKLVAQCGINCGACVAFFGYTMNGKKRKHACIGCRSRASLCAFIKKSCKALAKKDIESLYLEPGIATEQARIDYAAERIRLFFVGITRAKKELIITWNTGDTHHRDNKKSNPSLPFQA